MTTTHYNGSKGPVLIESMAYPHLEKAIAKLLREEPHRVDEINAMEARLASFPPIDENPPPREARIGDNNPPPDEPPAPDAAKPQTFEAIKAHCDDLLAEARNWADGVVVATQAQADTINRLIGDLRDADRLADNARVAEKKPLDDQIAGIQARFNEYIAPLKNTKPGKLPLAIKALNAALAPFLKAEEDRKAKAVEDARVAAEAAKAAAAAAIAEAHAADLTAQEGAADLLAAAEQAEKAVRKVENAKVHAGGGGGVRARGLRSSWKAIMTERRAALAHYIAEQPEQFVSLLQELADADVRSGKRQIPGFDVKEERTL